MIKNQNFNLFNIFIKELLIKLKNKYQKSKIAIFICTIKIKFISLQKIYND